MTQQTYAKIIRDSISPEGHRVTTFEARFHRYVLAEFNTHRVFSRNSESSRAVPWAKKVQRVTETPAIPTIWAAEQKGMQGGDEIDRPEEAEAVWLAARDAAVAHAGVLGSTNVHKSIVNRLLEPFMMHTVVVTSTSWQNFFGLRCNPMAQPEIRVAAEMMEEAYNFSTPQVVGENGWHLPYIDGDDVDIATEMTAGQSDSAYTEVLIKVSAARCARVSYLTQDGKRDLAEDIVLYDRLTSATPMHASPLEHVATPEPENRHLVPIKSQTFETSLVLELPKYGNLLGWHQHRFDVEALKQYQAYA